MMFAAVDGMNSIPNAMGILVAKKLLNLKGQWINSFVSGWIAVATIV